MYYEKKIFYLRERAFMIKKNESHEWIKVEKNIVTVGISSYAKKEIGEIVNVALPTLGKKIKANEEVCVIESTKSAIDIYSPVSGRIVEVNSELIDNLSLINESPENEGWLFKVEVEDIKELEGLS